MPNSCASLEYCEVIDFGYLGLTQGHRTLIEDAPIEHGAEYGTPTAE